MKRIIFIVMILFFSIHCIVAQEVYQTKGNLQGWRSWNSPENWVGGNIPPNYLPHGDKIIISEGDSMFYDKGEPLQISTTTAGAESFLTINGMLYTKQPVNLRYNAHVVVNGNFLIDSNLYMAYSVQLDINAGGYMGVSGLAEVKWAAAGSDLNLNVGGTFQITEGNNKLGKKFNDNGGTYIESTPEFPDDSTLPIELKSFTVNVTKSIANFKWITASEENNDYFTIEQSYDLQSWEEIHTEQGAGNSSVDLEYTAKIKIQKIGMYYFRLKQTDYDGKYTYSKIISAKNEELGEELIPKAVVTNGEIVIENDYNILQVFNMQGRLLKTYKRTNIINDLQNKGILIFVFDNKYKQKISKVF